MYRLPVVSGIMAHSEVEIVPVLDVGIVTHSQSLIPFAGIFPWTAVIIIMGKPPALPVDSRSLTDPEI